MVPDLLFESAYSNASFYVVEMNLFEIAFVISQITTRKKSMKVSLLSRKPVMMQSKDKYVALEISTNISTCVLIWSCHKRQE